MNTTLKIGIIGCGRIFELHAKAIEKMGNAQIVALCDIERSKAEAAANIYGGKVYEDYTQMKDLDLDIVHLCLPHYLHSVVGNFFAEQKVHVLTEKPVDVNVERAQSLIDTCKQEGVKLGVIFQNRYRKTNKKLHRFVQEGRLGKVLGAKMTLTWNRSDDYYADSGWKGFWDTEGGGVLIDQAIHTLDFLNWTVGGNIEYVKAHTYNVQHKKIEVEDTAHGLIRYKEGFNLLFYATNIYSYDAEVEAEIQLEEGVVRLYGSELEVIRNDGEIIREDISIEEILENEINNYAYWGTTHTDQITEFYDYVLGKRDDILVDGDEAMKIQKLIAMIYESSAKDGEAVYSQ